jgi:hypothetical protein
MPDLANLRKANVYLRLMIFYGGDMLLKFSNSFFQGIEYGRMNESGDRWLMLYFRLRARSDKSF